MLEDTVNVKVLLSLLPVRNRDFGHKFYILPPTTRTPLLLRLSLTSAPQRKCPTFHFLARSKTLLQVKFSIFGIPQKCRRPYLQQRKREKKKNFPR
ncbi:hypothetical protein CEXT_783061 [Caerostris extrusa]|uniref:Uncharacterized protein n=1 Tax=Caerostris extrusa TaxID=172846 RepID=A0AAV4R2M8_CAEEX|nr:hypothetical protein CEXT_783061 [Caerostris extrusa]